MIDTPVTKPTGQSNNLQEPHLLKVVYRTSDCRLAPHAGIPHEATVGDFSESCVLVSERFQRGQDALLSVGEIAPN
ncbi:MAG: hypothetical protein WCA13_19535 [Terriglobales bacterium]